MPRDDPTRRRLRTSTLDEGFIPLPGATAEGTRNGEQGLNAAAGNAPLKAGVRHLHQRPRPGAANFMVRFTETLVSGKSRARSLIHYAVLNDP